MKRFASRILILGTAVAFVGLEGCDDCQKHRSAFAASLQLVDDQGSPLADLSVALQDQDGGIRGFGWSVTDRNGRATVGYDVEQCALVERPAAVVVTGSRVDLQRIVLPARDVGADAALAEGEPDRAGAGKDETGDSIESVDLGTRTLVTGAEDTTAPFVLAFWLGDDEFAVLFSEPVDAATLRYHVDGIDADCSDAEIVASVQFDGNSVAYFAFDRECNYMECGQTAHMYCDSYSGCYSTSSYSCWSSVKDFDRVMLVIDQVADLRGRFGRNLVVPD